MIATNNNVKKTSQACDHCHKRRIKCQFDSHMGKCLNCYKLSQNCTFHRVPQKRGPHRKRKNDVSLLNYFKSQNVVSAIDSINYIDPSSSSQQQQQQQNNNNNIHESFNTTTPDTFPPRHSIVEYSIPSHKSNAHAHIHSHNLNEILEIYYNEVHPIISVFPVDTMRDFEDIVLKNVTEWKLKDLFHSIMETMFYGDEMEKANESGILWNELITLSCSSTGMDGVLYVICHFLIYLISNGPHKKLLGHCIGSYHDIKWGVCMGEEEEEGMEVLKMRLNGMIQLFDHIINKFENGGDSLMFVSGGVCVVPENARALVSVLNGGVGRDGGINRVWYEYREIVKMRGQLIDSIGDGARYDIITMKLCCLIHGMLEVLLHIDNDKYTDSLLQIVKHGNGKYRYEFGLKLIINQVMVLLDILKDIPSYLINMVIISSSDKMGMDDAGTIDQMVTHLSNSMNELVQITTLTYKLGGGASGAVHSTNPSEMGLEDRRRSFPVDNGMEGVTSHMMFGFEGGNSNSNSSSSNSNSNNTNSTATVPDTPRQRLHQLLGQLRAST